MNIEDEQRVLELYDRLTELAGKPDTEEVVRYLAGDVVWLVERVRNAEDEIHYYREAAQLAIDGTHIDL